MPVSPVDDSSRVGARRNAHPWTSQQPRVRPILPSLTRRRLPEPVLIAPNGPVPYDQLLTLQVRNGTFKSVTLTYGVKNELNKTITPQRFVDLNSPPVHFPETDKGSHPM